MKDKFIEWLEEYLYEKEVEQERLYLLTLEENN